MNTLAALRAAPEIWNANSVGRHINLSCLREESIPQLAFEDEAAERSHADAPIEA
jgi:hypothetical protein